MHQISPASSTEIVRYEANPLTPQQAALIGHFDAVAYLQGDLDTVVHEACRAAAEGVGGGIAGVLQYRADEDAFVLQAGVGWPACMVGRTRVAADLGTTAGLAWLTGQLVQFRQLDATGRIRVPEALAGQGVHRMVSLPIRSGSQRAFGVLEVGSAEAGEFTRHDLAFLQGIANSMAMAVGLHAGRLDVAAGRQGPAGVRYQQGAQGGAGGPVAAPGARLTWPSQFDRFLHATLGTERNGMDLSLLSVLAQVGHDPWTEAARLAELPRAAAADSLAATIACLPGESRPRAHARVVALCLVPLLPGQDHPVPDTLADGSRHDGCMRITLLTGAAFGAALAMWLLIGAAAWAISHAGPPDASVGATITSRPSPMDQPGYHQPGPKRPDQVHAAAVRAA